MVRNNVCESRRVLLAGRLLADPPPQLTSGRSTRIVSRPPLLPTGSPVIGEFAWEAAMSTEPQQSKKRTGVTGLAIPAGLFIGIGVGMLIGNTPAGVLLGLGAGFIGMIILRVTVGEW